MQGFTLSGYPTARSLLQKKKFCFFLCVLVQKEGKKRPYELSFSQAYKEQDHDNCGRFCVHLRGVDPNRR